jgi:asparagine synthase (glutamine-hydrolysing)
MCGIAGIVSLTGTSVPRLASKLSAMSDLIAHRGPDGHGVWTTRNNGIGLCHRRLAIIDLSDAAKQPMRAPNGTCITYNGEIFNYVELRAALEKNWMFRSRSDTECILAAYDRYGDACVEHLRGMFAFALWDERKGRLFCARDRFGIKPLYYTIVGDTLFFASETKALLPFLPAIETDQSALAEYLTFQYTINEHTLFAGIKQLLPGHTLCMEDGVVKVSRYWDVHYDIDFDHSPVYFRNRLIELVADSMRVHVRSDVPVGTYVSGGIDSSLVTLMAARADRAERLIGFHGRFTDVPGYDESAYARIVADRAGGVLNVVDISADHFRQHLHDVVYHLDYPVAGPGSFPQFMVSKVAAEQLKVVLGGQGGDEMFGGYARYLLAYFEQCIKAAIDGTYTSGNFVVTIESIVPNLGLLREYQPLMAEFWREGLFGKLDERYLRLVDRSNDMVDEIDWQALDRSKVTESFRLIFNNTSNVRKSAYFDSMTHFDFKCLLPALLQVEDRMSMAHGLESRVPFLDHALVEFAATVPADIKFQGGHMKHLLKLAFNELLPKEILQRRDKMGFPVPLTEWFGTELNDFVFDIFQNMKDKHRPYINADAVLRNFGHSGRFSRKTWGLLNLEIWHQLFHDRELEFRAIVDKLPSAEEELTEVTGS